MFKSTFKLDFRPLDRLTRQLKQNLLRRAIRRGANVGKEKIKSKSTGDYQKAVAVKVGSKADGRVYAATGVKSAYTGAGSAFYHHERAEKKPVRYAWWYEVGRHSGRPMTGQHIVEHSMDFAGAQTAIFNYLRTEFERICGE
jgi:hypothetical protein